MSTTGETAYRELILYVDFLILSAYGVVVRLTKYSERQKKLACARSPGLRKPERYYVWLSLSSSRAASAGGNYLRESTIYLLQLLYAVS